MNSETTFTNAEDFEDFCYMNLETENTEIIVESVEKDMTIRGSYNCVDVNADADRWDLFFLRDGRENEDDSYINISPKIISISRETEKYVWFCIGSRRGRDLNFRLKKIV